MSQSWSRDLLASESAQRRGVKMDNSLFLHRKLDDLVVVTRDGDERGCALDCNQLSAWRKLQSIGERRKARRYLRIGLVTSEPRLLSHRILELIEPEIRFSEIHSEVGANGENQQHDEAS